MTTRIILQDNLWFQGKPYYSNYRLNGRSMIPVQPKLGLTWSNNPRAKKKELRWINKYTGAGGSGVVVAQEWIKPGDVPDRNLQDPWLGIFERQAPEGKWCIFYDPILAAEQRGLLTPPERVNFKRKKIRRMWEKDLDYLGRYFQHPQYWRLRGGHPVLYIWAAYALENTRAAFRSARSRSLYLLADVLGTDRRPKYVNGLTGFTAALPRLARGDYLLNDLLPEYADAYVDAAKDEQYDMIPAASCQYDDSAFMAARGQGETPLRILATSRNDIEVLLKLALDFTLPIDGTRYVLWGTLNNWAEGTTVLPTKNRGPLYPGGSIGHYRFEHLRAIRNVLFPAR